MAYGRGGNLKKNKAKNPRRGGRVFKIQPIGPGSTLKKKGKRK